MHNAPLGAPLQDEEFARLETLLLSETWPENAMNLAGIDGLFAAVALSPQAIMPSQFLPLLLGQDEGQPEIDLDQEALQEALDLLMRHYNHVVRELRHPPDPEAGFMPLVYSLDEDADVPAEARAYHERTHGGDWAAGFLEGCGLIPEGAWQQVERQAPELLDGMAAALRLVENWAGDRLDEPNPLPLAEREALLEEVICMAEELSDYFLYNPWPPQQPVRRSTLPLRNDPCPCGSGKKYKKCCGDATRR